MLLWIPRPVTNLPYYHSIKPFLNVLSGMFTMGVTFLVAGIIMGSGVYFAGGILLAMHYPVVVFLLWREAKDSEGYRVKSKVG